MNDVWSSPDGNTWTQVTASAAFTAREDFCVAVLNGNMIVIGGWTGTTKGDIWSSADGITWNQITPAVSPLPGNTLGFLPRWGSADTIFNGLIWIWGGANGDPNPAHDIPLSGLNDEWTFDGTSLIQINDNSVNDGLVYHQFTANNGHLWLTPGSTPGYPSTPGYYNSADGNNWTAYPTYYQPRSGHLALSYNNSLWVMGGYYSGCWEPSGCAVTYYNDVWHNP
jgi:hypothetical protein